MKYRIGVDIGKISTITHLMVGLVTLLRNSRVCKYSFILLSCEVRSSDYTSYFILNPLQTTHIGSCFNHNGYMKVIIKAECMF